MPTTPGFAKHPLVKTRIKRNLLRKHRAHLRRYLKAKVEAQDWHAVSDAAIDLQVIEAQLRLMRSVVPRENPLVNPGPLKEPQLASENLRSSPGKRPKNHSDHCQCVICKPPQGFAMEML